MERTGIADYRAIALAMADEVRARGGEIRTGTEITAISEGADTVIVETRSGRFETRFLVACAGLQADRVARMAGLDVDFRIVPFRGEFYKLAPARGRIIRHLIYPIPDPALPFVGVHLTRMIDGSIKIGPNAVLARAREGYGKADINLRDLGDTLRYPGLLEARRPPLEERPYGDAQFPLQGRLPRARAQVLPLPHPGRSRALRGRHPRPGGDG